MAFVRFPLRFTRHLTTLTRGNEPQLRPVGKNDKPSAFLWHIAAQAQPSRSVRRQARLTAMPDLTYGARWKRPRSCSFATTTKTLRITMSTRKPARKPNTIRQTQKLGRAPL